MALTGALVLNVRRDSIWVVSFCGFTRTLSQLRHKQHCCSRVCAEKRRTSCLYGQNPIGSQIYMAVAE